ncbi:MAG: diaminopimelate epimerase [Bacteroidota bacterium]
MNQEDVRSIDFTKMSGAGNDFVVLDNRKVMISNQSEFARLICDRRKGIGADGLLLLEESNRADFMMKYFNSDGSYGGMCGNGGRCISRFARDKGIVSGQEIKFEALDYIYKASILTAGVALTMKEPTDFRLNQKIEIFKTSIHFHFVNSGSPHCVIFFDENDALGSSFEDFGIEKIGREIRNHQFFYPDGTNINFVKENQSSAYSIRTYERGVEAETLACGTGSVAVALIANRIKGSPSPITIHVRSGESLNVDFHKIGDTLYDNVSLSGSANVVFTGTVKYNFATQSIVDIF